MALLTCTFQGEMHPTQPTGQDLRIYLCTGRYSNLAEGGLYSVSITDTKNCPADTAFPVNDGTTLIAQVTAKTPVLCFGDDNGSAEITMTNGLPPFTYQWSDGLITPLNTRTNMAPGTYQVNVTDAATPVALHSPG